MQTMKNSPDKNEYDQEQEMKKIKNKNEDT